MLFKNISIIDENLDHKENMYVATEGGKITYVGSIMPESYVGDEYDGSGKLLMSGFYNIHSHSPMSLLRGYGENMTLSDWLNKRIFPFEAKMNAADNYNGSLLSIAEMIRGGVVSNSDMYYRTPSLIRAARESGFKTNLSVPVLCFDDSSLRDLPVFSEMTSMDEDGILVKCEYSIHAEYTSTPKVVRELAERAMLDKKSIHVHLSETKNEHEECIARHGMTPTAYFESLGVFNVPTTAAHCVWADENDIEIMSKNGVTVACNPTSNMKLASGFANVKLMLEKGVNVGLGTDGSASNNTLDMINELKMFALIYKGISGDPTVVTPKQSLAAATVNGAKAQRRQGGLVKEGYDADLIVLDTTRENYTPVHEMINNVVYSSNSRDVVLTMINGKVVYKNGEFMTIDLEKAKYEAKKSVERILNEL